MLISRSLAILFEQFVECACLDCEIKIEHLLGHILTSLLQHMDQTPGQQAVSPGEETVRASILPCSPSPPDPVHIGLYGGGEGVVDHILYIRNIQASSSNICRQ